MKRNYLTRDQIFTLNEKHGWFQAGDAQSAVSNQFAQDAIEMHERLRAAAPVMLAALKVAELSVAQLCEGQDPANQCWFDLAEIQAAIAAAGAA